MDALDLSKTWQERPSPRSSQYDFAQNRPTIQHGVDSDFESISNGGQEISDFASGT